MPGKSIVILAFLGFSIFSTGMQACTCDPNVQFTNVAEWNNNPIAATTQVNVNLGNSTTAFVETAWYQVFGTTPPVATVNAQVSNFTNDPWWRRIDTMNTFINMASNGASITKNYSDPWTGDTAFTTAPCKTLSRDVGADCMFFFNCPGGVNCGMDWANTHAMGMNAYNSLLASIGGNGYYNPNTNAGYWYLELMDARYAGLQFLMPNVYGSDLVGTNNENNLVTALSNISGQGLSSQVKIGMFDDTSGWGAPGSVSPYNVVPNMASNPSGAASSIAAKWEAFLGPVKSYWYTVGTTGRPIIYFYNGGTLGTTNAGTVITQAKADFAAAEGGISPYVVVDSYFFADAGMASAADGAFVWDTLHSSPSGVNGISLVQGSNLAYSTHTGTGGYIIDNAMVKWDPTSRNNNGSWPNYTIASSTDGLIKSDAYLVNDLTNTQSDTILTIGTWNDLGEGTGINRNYDYYVNGAWQPPNYFMNDIRASQSQQSCGVVLPTLTMTPTISPTFTLTPTPTHGPLLANMETPSTNNRTLWNEGAVDNYVDIYGTTSNHTPWLTSSATVGDNGPSLAGNYAACWSGTMVSQTATLVPYSFMAFECIPGGAISSTQPGSAFTDVTAFDSNSGIQFDYQSSLTGTTFELQVTTKQVTDYNYYGYYFTSTDTNWHTLTVYWPQLTTAVPVLAQPPWANPQVAFDPTNVGAVIFQVLGVQNSPQNYSLCVDNITFQVNHFSTRTPTVTPTYTRSPTSTSTFTVTPSATRTTTPTLSSSPTPSASPSQTLTLSPTPSASPSNTPPASPTGTPSLTRTPTASPSMSLTSSPSVSPSVTPPPTKTATPSASPSLTNTPYFSPTNTPAGTLTDTPTSTISATVTPSYSVSPSSTESVTLTRTPSPSASPSNSATLTASPSASPSGTPSPSFSASPTPSISATVTPSVSISPSLTISPSVTISPSPSNTIQASPSRTVSASLTVTPNPTQSFTGLPSPSFTASPSSSETKTATPSVTTAVSPSFTNSPIALTPSPSFTFTGVPAGSGPGGGGNSNGGSGSVLKCLPALNPQAGPNFQFAVQLSNPSNGIHFRIYSRAMVAIEDVDIPGNWQGGWNKVNLRIAGLTNGLYFVLTRTDEEAGYTHSNVTYLMVIQ